jgi:protein arginine kinase activator
MICQDCNQNESTVHLTQIVNNKKLILNLCKECAEKRGFHSPFEHMPFPLAELVNGMVGSPTPAIKAGGKKGQKVKKCQFCGMTFEDFSKVGRLGCGKCYDAFRPELTDLLRKIHGSHLHRGKVTNTISEAAAPLKEERRLRDELKKAIDGEEFEKAAALRDQLRTLSDAE